MESIVPEPSAPREGHRWSKQAARWLGAALALAAADVAAQIEAPVLSTDIAPAQLKALSVECPPGSVAVGGGTQVVGDPGIDLTSNAPRFGMTSLLSTPDGPAGPPSGWEGGAANGSGSPGTLHVGVSCSSEMTVSTVVVSTSVGAGTFAGATAECPDGTVAIGGGVALGNLTMRISETSPRMPIEGVLASATEGLHEAPDAWTAFAYNPGGGSPIMKVVALCANLADVYTLVEARNVAASGGTANGAIECTSGGKALGGGIASLNPLGLTLTTSAQYFPGNDPELAQQPNGTAPAPVGWDSRARNDSDQTLVVKRAAICVPEPARPAMAVAAWAALTATSYRRRSRSTTPRCE